MRNFFFRLFRPQYWWPVTYGYDPEWDVELQCLANKHTFKPIIVETSTGPYLSEFEVELNGEKIWIKNFPYASFHRTYRNGKRWENAPVPYYNTQDKMKEKVIDDCAKYMAMKYPIEFITHFECIKFWQSHLRNLYFN